MSLLNSYRHAAAAGGFDVETDIAWHSLFYAGGAAMTALGYADGAAVTTWPNETTEVDATSTAGATFDAVDVNLNNQPSVAVDTSTNDLKTAAFTVAPSYAASVSIVGIGHYSSGVGNRFFVDGPTTATRNAIWVSNGTRQAIYAGSTVQLGAGTHPIGAHGYVGLFDGGAGADSLRFDGVLGLSGSAGSQQLTGLHIGRAHSPVTTAGYGGTIAFVGVFEGDITADGSWADLVTWAFETYGVTL